MAASHWRSGQLRRQLPRLHAAAAAADGAAAPPALVLQLSVQPSGGRSPSVLHVLQLHGGGSGAAQEQWHHLLKLLNEVADLHCRRRQGELA